jgi:hypothetical protein
MMALDERGRDGELACARVRRATPAFAAPCPESLEIEDH